MYSTGFGAQRTLQSCDRDVVEQFMEDGLKSFTATSLNTSIIYVSVCFSPKPLTTVGGGSILSRTTIPADGHYYQVFAEQPALLFSQSNTLATSERNTAT
jgi:hypothetical protein